MKALHFTDLHAHVYKNFGTPDERLRNCLKVLIDLADFAHAKGITVIFFSGDLYDTQKAIFTQVVNEMVSTFIHIFGKYPNLKFYAVSGNHDQSSKNLLGAPAVTALSHLAELFPSNFILVDNKVVPVCEGVAVAGIPYYEYPEHYAKMLEHTSSEVAAAKAGFEEEGKTLKVHLLNHQTAKGIGNAMIPYDTDPTDPLYDIYDAIWCGHIHGRQELTSKFTNVGSPIHRDMGDAGQVKGFYVSNLAKPENGKVFIPLKGYPEFHTYKEGDEITEQERASNFVVIEPDYSAIADHSTARVEEFNTSLEKSDLLTNYWKEAGESNNDLLTIGLELIQ